MDFFHTHIADDAIQRASDVLRSTYISEGKLVREFERRLAAEVGLVRPVALNSGTTALHMAVLLAGVAPGDEVILPAQTFVATGLVVMAQRATPVFCDVDPTTGNTTAPAIEAKITERTRAIMVVHWGGYPCDMDEICTLADRHSLPVIEDAAHALGATYRGRPVGSIARFTAFSFQAIKHVTTGDGGAICCLNESDAQQAFVRRWFGIDRANSTPSILGERHYDIATVGDKWHLNDLGAAVGLGNLTTFPDRLRRRRLIAGTYRASLAGMAGVELLREEEDRVSACWLFTMLVERREDFIRALAAHGIPASVVHQRIDRNSVFGGMAELPGQAEFNERQIAIPVHEGLSDDDVGLIVDSVRAGW